MADDRSDGTENEALPVSAYLSMQEAVRISRMSAAHLRRMAGDGRLRALKFGHFWMVHAQSLADYLAHAEQSPDKRLGPREDP